MKRTIELPDEFLDDILIDILTRDYEREQQQILRLSTKSHLLDFEMEDLRNSRKMTKALKRILKYYGEEV